MKSDLLLLYIREDGVFVRLLTKDASCDKAVRTAVSESTVRHMIRTAVTEVTESYRMHTKSVVIAYAMSKRVDVLWSLAERELSAFPFADSVSRLRRDELFYRSVSVVSDGMPKQILYCDSRETRLFTDAGEFLLPSGVTGGNGFVDWLQGFVEIEGDSLSYFLGQTKRLAELYRVYRVFPYQNEMEFDAEERLFPDRTAHPILTERPKEASEKSLMDTHLARFGDAKTESVGDENDPVDSPIRYFALKDTDRERVDKKYPALYRSVRDRWGNYRQISIGKAAEAFRTLFLNIEDAPLTDVVAVGAYADFPLVRELLQSLPHPPHISYASESRILLDSMEQAVRERMAFSRLIISDMDGDPVVLWDADGYSPKRISFAVTLREKIPTDQWQKGNPIIPYTLEMKELYQTESGAFAYRRKTVRGDLKSFCYKRRKDGAYHLALPVFEDNESAFRTVTLGLSATPLGVVCHLIPQFLKEK